MNRAAAAAVLALAFLSLTLAVPEGAAACSGRRMAEVGTPVGTPDMVFTGTVVKRDEPFSFGMGTTKGDTPIGWTFVVESIETGPQLERVRVESPLMDASCGIEFTLGQRYRVQAHDEGGSLRAVSGDATQLDPLPDALRPPTEAGGLTFGMWPAAIGFGAVLLPLGVLAFRAGRSVLR